MTLPLPGVPDPSVDFNFRRVAQELPAIKAISAGGTVLTNQTMAIQAGAGVSVGTNAAGVILSAGSFTGSVGGVAIGNSQTTFNTGVVNLVGTGNVAISSGAGQQMIIDASQSLQPVVQIAASDTIFDQGPVYLSGYGNISISTSIDTDFNQIIQFDATGGGTGGGADFVGMYKWALD